MMESKINEVLKEIRDKQNLAIADDEMILAIASKILEEHKAAFLELAK